MESRRYRFRVGSFECVALSDGAFNYPLESLFANVSVGEIQAALQQHGLPVTHVTTPYTCLLIDTGAKRILIDTGAGNLSAQADKLFTSGAS